MSYPVKNGQTSVVLRFKLLDSSSSVGAGLTGLSNASSGLRISTIADNEASATAYTVAGSTVETITTLGTYAAPTATKCRFKEVDSTNHPGLYEFQFADARFAVSSAKSLVISVSGATNLAQADYVMALVVDDPYTAKITSGTGSGQISLASGAVTVGTNNDKAGYTASIVSDKTGYSLSQTFPSNFSSLSIDGSGRMDVAKIAGTAQTARDIGASVLLSTGTGTGQLDFTSGVVKANVTQNAGTNITSASGVQEVKVASIAANAINAAAINADAITAAKIADGAIDAATFAASALDAVWSTAARTLTAGTNIQLPANGLANISAWTVAITGNITGNLSGSAGSIATGGITAASFAAGAIDNAAIATDAIGSAELASSAVSEIQSGLSTLDAAAVRTAVGLGSANLDTQLSAIAGYIDTEVGAIKAKTDQLTFTVTNQVDVNVVDWKGSVAPAMTGDAFARLGVPAGASVSVDIAAVKAVDDAVKAKTDNLPSDPADASDIASSFSTVNGTLATIAGYIDTEVAAIKAKTDNLPASPAAVGSAMTLTVAYDAAKTAATQTSVDDMPTNAELATALGTADDAVLAAIAALNNISAANVKTQADAALADAGVTTTVTGRIDAAISSRLATSGYTAPANSTIAAIDAKTTNLPSDPADQSLIITATDAIMGRLGAPAGASVSADIAGISDALPTANENADALLDRADGIEAGLTPRQAIRLSAAADAGKLSGGATTTNTIRNAVADSKNRIVATVDASGNRTAITYDLT